MCTVTLTKFESHRTLCLLFCLILGMNIINRMNFLTELQSVCFEVRTEILCVPVATLSKTLVCDHSLAGILGLNPTGGMDVCCVLYDV
jgi:hypothetical protein